MECWFGHQLKSTVNALSQISGNTAILPYIRYCGSNHLVIWKAVMFVYKGLLLLFGTYLAWETRKVHIPALNDSKLIGMSVYNVVVPCVLIIPIRTVLESNRTASFALVSFLTIFCTTFTLCIVFIPKVGSPCYGHSVKYSSNPMKWHKPIPHYY